MYIYVYLFGGILVISYFESWLKSRDALLLGIVMSAFVLSVGLRGTLGTDTMNYIYSWNHTPTLIDFQASVDYFFGTREFPYKNISPCILAEKYINDGGEELQDYKFMCFNGSVKCSFVCTECFSKDGLKVTFLDRDWKILPFTRKYVNSKVPIIKPTNYDKMIELAEVIAREIANSFVRIDFYNVKGEIYFGEITFFPGSGMEVFYPEEWDRILGDWIN